MTAVDRGRTLTATACATTGLERQRFPDEGIRSVVRPRRDVWGEKEGSGEACRRRQGRRPRKARRDPNFGEGEACAVGQGGRDVVRTQGGETGCPRAATGLAGSGRAEIREADGAEAGRSIRREGWKPRGGTDPTHGTEEGCRPSRWSEGVGPSPRQDCRGRTVPCRREPSRVRPGVGSRSGLLGAVQEPGRSSARAVSVSPAPEGGLPLGEAARDNAGDGEQDGRPDRSERLEARPLSGRAIRPGADGRRRTGEWHPTGAAAGRGRAQPGTGHPGPVCPRYRPVRTQAGSASPGRGRPARPGGDAACQSPSPTGGALRREWRWR